MGDSSRRVVAVSFQPALPTEPARVFYEERLWHDQDTWVGPIGQFQAALHRLPDRWQTLKNCVGAVLGLSTEEYVRGKSGESPKKTLIMGVLNVTPDSFYDGGRYVQVEQAIERAKQMVADGADIIDVGGESTRPHAEFVPPEEEMARVVPVIRALSQEVHVPISIDTYKGSVAQAALQAGAGIVNDISGLQFDPNMAHIVAEEGAGVVIMHIQGTPRTMQENPYYNDVIGEIKGFLAQSCDKAMDAGVDAQKIWIDPGIGFGKTVEHNVTILDRLREFRALGFPILVGTSNKSMIGHVLNVDVDERKEGTAATVALAIANGADAVRVHDVKAMGRVAAMSDAIVREAKK